MVIDSFLYRTQTQYTDLAFTAQNYGWQGSVMEKHFSNLSKGRIKKSEKFYTRTQCMWCIFLMHFIIYVRKLRRVAHRCVLHVFCALPPPTRRMCTLKFQLNDVHGLIFYLSVFCFITSTGTLLYYLHLNICNDLKCYTCVIPLPVIALLIVFLSDACHLEKIKP